ncbi:MAG: gamma-glutamylcyclotransferase family protein [Myxococcota bacterium]
MPHYFAFGSNLSHARLAARVSIRADLGPARLSGWRLVCDKAGDDGSAKANLAADPTAEVWGVLYDLTDEALDVLDGYEGGYRREEVDVAIDGRTIPAVTYVSSVRRDGVMFDWYKAHLVTGAAEHGLPGAYCDALRALPSRPDPHR